MWVKYEIPSLIDEFHSSLNEMLLIGGRLQGVCRGFRTYSFIVEYNARTMHGN